MQGSGVQYGAVQCRVARMKRTVQYSIVDIIVVQCSTEKCITGQCPPLPCQRFQDPAEKTLHFTIYSLITLYNLLSLHLTIYFFYTLQYTFFTYYNILSFYFTIYFLYTLQYTLLTLYNILALPFTIYFLYTLQYTFFTPYNILSFYFTIYFLYTLQYTL